MISKWTMLFSSVCLALILFLAFGPYTMVTATSEASTGPVSSGDVYFIDTSTASFSQGMLIRYWDAGSDTFRLGKVGASNGSVYVVDIQGRSTSQENRVPRPAIVGNVVTIDGRVAAVPGIAPVVVALRIARPMLIAGLLTILTGGITQRQQSTRQHKERNEVTRIKDVARPLFIAGLVTALIFTPVATETYKVALIGPGEQQAALDNATVETVSLRYDQRPFTHLIITAEEASVRDWQLHEQNLSVRLDAKSPRSFTATVNVYPYPAVLPESMVRSLHSYHPVVAILCIAAIIFIIPATVYVLFIDGERPISSTRPR